MTIAEINARLEAVQRFEDIAKEIEELDWDIWAWGTPDRLGTPLPPEDQAKVWQLLAERRRLEMRIEVD